MTSGKAVDLHKLWPVVRATRAVLLSATAMACVTGTTGTLDPATVRGEIRFDPADAAVLSHLASRPPVVGGNVVTTQLGDPLAHAGSLYIIATGTAAPELGQFEIHPIVPESGARLSFEVREMRFQGGGSYRFGSSEPTSLAALVTPAPVLPLSADPDGTEFDIVECAALATVKVRVTGLAADLAAVTPVACAVVAAVAENPLGAIFTQQATATVLAPSLAELQAGLDVPILVRAGQPVRFTAICVMQPEEPGFPVSPDLPGGTVEFTETSLPFDAVCGTGLDAEVDVEVFRSFGSLMGKVGAPPHDLTQYKIQILETPLSLTQNNVTGPGPHDWNFPSVNQGAHRVRGTVVLDNGAALLRFPELAGVDRPIVPEAGPYDLKARLVAQPAHIASSLTLRDPNPATLLAHLWTDSIYLDEIPRATVVRGQGISGRPQLEDGSFGADGVNAHSWASYVGSFDATTGQAELLAELPIVGLGRPEDTYGAPTAADLAGSNVLPADWEVPSVEVHLRGPDGFSQRTTIDRMATGLFRATPGASESIPPLDVCFGTFKLLLQARPGFRIFRPELFIESATSMSALDDRGLPIAYRDVSGFSRDDSLNASTSQEQVEIKLALPAGFSYDLRPALTFVGANGGLTEATVEPQFVGLDGGVDCGREEALCIQFLEGDEQSELRVGIDSVAACDPRSVQVGVSATSTGGAIIRVEVSVDGGAPSVVCDGVCPSPFQQLIDLGALIPGPHSVTVVVTDSFCVLPVTQSVVVGEQLMLHCPGAFTTQPVGDSRSVPYGDIANRLQASWTGGCVDSPTPTVLDDHPADFPVGETVVRFFTAADGSPGSGQACETKVTVLPPNGCVDFDDMPAGAVAAPFTIGDVQFHPQNNTAFVIGSFAQGAPGQHALELVGTVDVDLPFTAQWVRIRMVKASGPLRVVSTLDTGTVTDDWTSDVGNDDIIKTYVFQNPARHLRLSVVSGEVQVVEICYSMNRPPTQGDLLVAQALLRASILRAQFGTIDADGDGVITHGEYLGAAVDGGATAEDAESSWENASQWMDLNGDGAISLVEPDALYLKFRFTTVDTDGDLFISQDEYVEWFAQAGGTAAEANARWSQLLSLFDQNADGKLQLVEL